MGDGRYWPTEQSHALLHPDEPAPAASTGPAIGQLACARHGIVVVIDQLAGPGDLPLVCPRTTFRGPCGRRLIYTQYDTSPGVDNQERVPMMTEQARTDETREVVTDAELVDDQPGTMLDLAPRHVLERFRGIPVVKIDDAETVQARLNAQRLDAKTVEELMAGRKTVAAKDFTYHPFEARDVHFMESSFDSGLGVYVAIDACERDTGELLTVVTGAADIVIQMAKLADFKALPALVQILPSNQPTDGRNPALHLELVPNAPPAQ